MKRYVALLLAVCMILSVAALAGCGKKVVPVENGNPAPVSGAESAVDSASASDNAEATEAAAVSTVTLNPTAFTAKAGDYELSFEPIALGGNTGGAGSHDFCGDYSEGKYYLSDKNAKKVFVYTINGTTADLEKEYDTETGFEKITANHNGDILLSQGFFRLFQGLFRLSQRVRCRLVLGLRGFELALLRMESFLSLLQLQVECSELGIHGFKLVAFCA